VDDSSRLLLSVGFVGGVRGLSVGFVGWLGSYFSSLLWNSPFSGATHGHASLCQCTFPDTRVAARSSNTYFRALLIPLMWPPQVGSCQDCC
jgi:hypothetical protein